MIHIVGAGSGAVDLITVRGARLLGEADTVVYAGSLVNPDILTTYTKPDCEIYDSARMTLEEVLQVLITAERAGKKKKKTSYGCIPVILVCTVLYGNRWMLWIPLGCPMK